MKPQDFNKELDARQAQEQANAQTQAQLDATTQAGAAPTDALHQLNMTTFMSAGGYGAMAMTMQGLTQQLQQLEQKFKDAGAFDIARIFDSLVNRLTEAEQVLSGSTFQVDQAFLDSLAALKDSVDKVDFNPTINVQAPEPKVIDKTNFSEVVSALSKVEQAIKDAPQTEASDLQPVIDGLSSVRETIKNLRFPSANYVLPFMTQTGKATQLKLNDDGSIPTTPSTSGTTSVNLTQINGVTALVGAGNTGTGSPRVTIASDQAAIPVTTTPTVATTLYNGKKTVTTAGTRVTLASSQVVKSVVIKALVANTGVIYVGDGSVASTTGFALTAGDTVSLDIANLATVNLDSSVNGEGVTYIASN